MSKKTAVKVQEQNRDNDNRAIRPLQKTEGDRLKISEHELDAILGELIESMDQHFIEAAFNFRTNLNDTPGYWSNHPYVEGFIDKLKPHARLVEKRLRRVLPDQYPETPMAEAEPDEDLTTMVCDLEQCAYVIGVFIGAKLAGASADRLSLLRKHLIF